jgi:hypothetical protein
MTMQRAALFCLMASSVLVSQPLVAQEVAGVPQRDHVPSNARQMVVRVNVLTPVGDTALNVGSGVIVRTDRDSVYVVTAAHVIGEHERVRVELGFSGDPNRRVPASLRPQTSALDIRVLTVDRKHLQGWWSEPNLSGRMGDPQRLKAGSAVWPLGCPNEQCWTAPASPDRVMTDADRSVLFQSFFVGPGSSGGALFNEWWEVVGIVLNHQPPRVDAVSIDIVRDSIRSWGVSSTLREPSVPSDRYRTTIGAMLFSTALDSTQAEGQIPSGRATFSHRSSRHVAWHAGFLRITPTDLAISAGVGGLAFEQSLGRRLSTRIFGEAAFGRVEARYEVSRYYVTEGSATRPVIVYDRVVDDRPGFGGGLSLELILLPRIIIEGTGGWWRFSLPDHAPAFNKAFYGAGLRLGL